MKIGQESPSAARSRGWEVQGKDLDVLAQNRFCWTPISLWGQVKVELSTFTPPWLSLCPPSCAVPTARCQPCPRGAHTPLPSVLMCQGREEPGQDVLGLPNRSTAASQEHREH